VGSVRVTSGSQRRIRQPRPSRVRTNLQALRRGRLNCTPNCSRARPLIVDSTPSSPPSISVSQRMKRVVAAPTRECHGNKNGSAAPRAVRSADIPEHWPTPGRYPLSSVSDQNGVVFHIKSLAVNISMGLRCVHRSNASHRTPSRANAIQGEPRPTSPWKGRSVRLNHPIGRRLAISRNEGVPGSSPGVGLNLGLVLGGPEDPSQRGRGNAGVPVAHRRFGPKLAPNAHFRKLTDADSGPCLTGRAMLSRSPPGFPLATFPTASWRYCGSGLALPGC
jgi:hypothetical protein